MGAHDSGRWAGSFTLISGSIGMGLSPSVMLGRSEENTALCNAVNSAWEKDWCVIIHIDKYRHLDSVRIRNFRTRTISTSAWAALCVLFVLTHLIVEFEACLVSLLGQQKWTFWFTVHGRYVLMRAEVGEHHENICVDLVWGARHGLTGSESYYVCESIIWGGKMIRPVIETQGVIRDWAWRFVLLDFMGHPDQCFMHSTEFTEQVCWQNIYRVGGTDIANIPSEFTATVLRIVCTKYHAWNCARLMNELPSSQTRGFSHQQLVQHTYIWRSLR